MIEIDLDEYPIPPLFDLARESVEQCEIKKVREGCGVTLECMGDCNREATRKRATGERDFRDLFILGGDNIWNGYMCENCMEEWLGQTRVEQLKTELKVMNS